MQAMENLRVQFSCRNVQRFNGQDCRTDLTHPCFQGWQARLMIIKQLSVMSQQPDGDHGPHRLHATQRSDFFQAE
ncbi:hypothetical protein RRG08_008426 [Elysia crispata]|uniref:Uncharacterized protein n=1 Tax=Elysia crispata TaxID=231223 RepID=A0AAE1DGZ8_9GAST|nr:hypothetical protein RRG08_008426 [Elysia crispata]